MTPPFPPRGPLGRFPRLTGTMEALRLPTACLVRLRIARRADTAVAPVSFPSTGTRGRGPGSWSAGSRAGTSAGAVGPPRFLGNPDAPLPWSTTPAGPDSPGRLRRSGAAPPRLTRKAPAKNRADGAQYKASAPAVYASRRRLPGRRARLASGSWPDVAGRDWIPAGFHRKVLETHISSPLPRLILAH